MAGSEKSAALKSSRVIMVVVLLALAFTARYFIADRAIWFDERFTLDNTVSVSAAVEHCLRDVHPPLYFVLTAVWRSVFPSTEFSLRFLSLMFGMTSLLGLFLVGRSTAGFTAGIAALAIGAFSPYHWLYSTELRPYPVFLAFSTLSTWAFLSALKRGGLRDFLLFALFTTLNLYTHYFAVFLLISQGVAFAIVAAGNSARGHWSAARRNRQIVYGIMSLALVALAYAPWAGYLRRVVSDSMEGRVVGVGRRVGRGVTLNLVGRSIYDSLGQGPLPFLVQAALVVCALVCRKFREACILFLVTFILPFVLLFIYKPAHFIAPKYFIFSYPIAVAMVATGLFCLNERLSGRSRWPAAAPYIILAAVALLPLLPGQHEPYAFHRSDWKVIVSETRQYLAEGDRICFPRDAKSHAMVIHYTEDDFLRRYPEIPWREAEGVESFVSLESGTAVWFLRRGDLPEVLAAGLGEKLEPIKTWRIYPSDVSLYRFIAEGPHSSP